MTSLCFGNLRSYALSLFKKYHSVRFVSHKGAYEGDGKTTITILNKDIQYGLMVNTISTVGFTLNMKFTVLGAMIIFPKSVIGWNIASTRDIHEDSLALFKVLSPKPDIVILGLDQNYPRDEPFILDFRKVIKGLGISVEILPVDRACQTFNFLNAENRYIIGAFLPPKIIEETDKKLLEHQVIQKVLGTPHKKLCF